MKTLFIVYQKIIYKFLSEKCAENLGRMAFNFGLDDCDNPYNENDDRIADWHGGYTEAWDDFELEDYLEEHKDE